jgi:hypothetical protein
VLFSGVKVVYNSNLLSYLPLLELIYSWRTSYFWSAIAIAEKLTQKLEVLFKYSCVVAITLSNRCRSTGQYNSNITSLPKLLKMISKLYLGKSIPIPKNERNNVLFSAVKVGV